jgi:glycosidase
VAYAIPKPFLAPLTEQVRASHPDALLFGEMIHGDQGGFATATGLHGVTQYELHKAIWSSLHDRNCWELAHALTRHADFCTTSTPITFLGNHDVTRIRSRIVDAHVEHALAILATVPGSPCTYYGDELGFAGEKTDGLGGDDAIRPPLPDHAGGVDDRFERWISFRREHPELTTAPLVVDAKTNTTIDYRVGDLRVRLDLDGGVELG